MNELEAMHPTEIDALIDEQNATKINCIDPDASECHDLIKESLKHVRWLSDRGCDAVNYKGMIPETALFFFNVPDSEIDNLWTQSGCEWHHARMFGRSVKIKFYRLIQVRRFGINLVGKA